MGACPTLTLITSTICQAHAAGHWKIKQQRGTEKSLPTMTAQNCDAGGSGLSLHKPITLQRVWKETPSIFLRTLTCPSCSFLLNVFSMTRIEVCVIHCPGYFPINGSPVTLRLTHSRSQLGLFTTGLPASLQLSSCPSDHCRALGKGKMKRKRGMLYNLTGSGRPRLKNHTE